MTIRATFKYKSSDGNLLEGSGTKRLCFTSFTGSPEWIATPIFSGDIQ